MVGNRGNGTPYGSKGQQDHGSESARAHEQLAARRSELSIPVRFSRREHDHAEIPHLRMERAELELRTTVSMLKKSGADKTIPDSFVLYSRDS
jgi:hypothetical protein